MADAMQKLATSDEGIDHVPDFDKSKRKCTDVLCCAFFGVFWIGMIIIAAIAATQGDINSLIYGTDHEGKVCGVDGRGKYLTYPRLAEDIRQAAQSLGSAGTPASASELADNLDQIHFFGVCMASCPKAGDTVAAAGKTYTFNLNTTSVLFRCFPKYRYESSETRRCQEPAGASTEDCDVVTVTETLRTTKLGEDNYAIDKANGFYARMAGYFGDLVKSWYVVLVAGVVMAFLIGFAFLYIMKYCAGCIVWSIISLLLIGCFGVTFYAYVKAGLVNADDITSAASGVPGNFGNRSSDFFEGTTGTGFSQEYFRYGAYVLTAFDIVFLLLIISLRSRIHLAVAIVKEASGAIADMPLMVAFPFVTVMCITALAMYWLFISALIMSAGDLKAAANMSTAGANGTFDALEVKFRENIPSTNYMVLYHFFGLLWTNNFFQGIGSMTLAGCVAMWYFSTNSGQNEDGAPENARGWRRIWFFYSMVWRYHLGTVAFGSAIIAIVQFLRAVLTYVDHKTREVQRNNLMVRIVMKSVHCCLWCFQKCLEYVSSLAYTYTIMYGISFCTAGKYTIILILKNVLRISTINTVSFLITLAGRVFVTCLCGFIAFLWVDNASNFKEGGSDELSSEWLPVLFSLIVAFFISTIFFRVYDLTIDTILLCFCQDEKIAGEIHAGENLAPILDKAEKQAKHETGKDGADEGKPVAVA